MKNELKQIAAIQKKINEPSKKPLNDSELQNFTAIFLREFEILPPTGYLRFLSNSDGLDFNGYRIYGATDGTIDGVSQGIFEMNRLLREYTPEELADLNSIYVYFGDSGMDRFILNKSNMLFYSIDRVSGDIVESFESAEEMITFVLKEMLRV